MALRLRRKEFDLEGGGTISRCDLTVRSWQDDLFSTILTVRALWRDLAARSHRCELNGTSRLGMVV